ncbi:preprotein translocase subunit YajC [Anatilimnocola floriformis]|uniref:preprotein translocase subunit YajC n=1 Tax=Anatilimnocola floriformis TaxID=2948575 RepID=UPI0020C441AE|nr:preprotein translocase subunit YajC [Anatilimnocola floriformis]
MSGLLAFLYLSTLLLAQASDDAAPAKAEAPPVAAQAPAAKAPATQTPAVKADAKPRTVDDTGDPSSEEPAPAANNGGGGLTDALFSTYALPLGAMLLLMYFMLLRPEQKKRKEVESTLSNLKKNDHIVTIGGICGTVVNISPNSTYITIKVDESNNTRLKILRSAVARVGQVEDVDNKIETKKESA